VPNPLPDWLSPPPGIKRPEFCTERDVLAALAADDAGPAELAALLSPAADALLEPMAQRAQALTVRHFGRTITLYVPLYLSNYCSSGCVYCGFASDRTTPRSCLSEADASQEMDKLKQMGFEEVLLLTGERTPKADFEYLERCVAMAATRFHQVTVEAFPMGVDEYQRLSQAGCAGITLYQETYDPEQYERLHRWGPKRDYAARLEAPEHALQAGMRTVGIGALLGLSEPVMEATRLLQHARHLRSRYWRSGISISFPRVRPEAGGFKAPFPVDDTFLAKLIFAFRICLRDMHLVLSTRESPQFRDGMAGVGISKMSIGSRTTVGGYVEDRAKSAPGGQFEVSDQRDITTFCNMLCTHHLQPLFKNWDAAYRDAPPRAAAAFTVCS